ncbi:serpin family protein [Enhygromyxa salina]|uniref:Serpin (Serine protease inhibitor) n=1 Tax=Enhygromyxa salina TaxID=215803 RepID=A0A2S9YN17_9BACT|nr:serpin family protein [Enhygromyxa salina]PRQ06465.1 Serpin (serine protease inhibitor) [Enhygromyxa salina]
MRRVRCVCALLSLGFVSACSGVTGEDDAAGETSGDVDDDDDNEDPSGWTVVESELPRDIHPMPTSEETAALASDQLALALDVYHALRADPENQSFCVSAYGLQHGLGMLYAGSAGVAKAQMQTALHFSLADDRQHVALNWQELELQERNLEALDEPGQHKGPLVLTTVNAIWLAQALGGAVETDYLDRLAVNYGVGLFLADFSTDQSADTERQAINAWISERTHARIDQLFPSEALSRQTTVVLASALDLEAPWMVPFDVAMTATEPFELSGGDEIMVDMMTHPALEARFGQGADYTALAIPLRGISLELVLIVPEGQLGEFEAGLDVARVTTLLDDLVWEHVDTHVPRFELRADLPLTSVLADELGMPAPFGDPAAFSGIVSDGVGVLEDVFHDSVITVDEHGVEAAVGVGAGVVATAGVNPSQAFWVDAPFIVMIHDRPTRSVLFLGRVLDPRGPGSASRRG